MEVNLDKIRKITSEINKALGLLEEVGNLSEREFNEDPHKIGSAKYHLIVAIEGIVDLCQHLIARCGFRAPEDYADTFRVMQEEGVFQEAFTDSLIQMVRFRNRLVHIYWDVEPREIHRILKTRLGDIKRFLEEFGAYVQKRGVSAR